MKKSPVRKSERQLATVHQGALIIADQNANEILALRLAEGESWNTEAIHLAMLLSGEAYINKLRIKPTDRTDAPGPRTRQVTIRRNSHTPEYEPSRHEMRIFDALDGIVTEM